MTELSDEEERELLIARALAEAFKLAVVTQGYTWMDAANAVALVFSDLLQSEDVPMFALERAHTLSVRLHERTHYAMELRSATSGEAIPELHGAPQPPPAEEEELPGASPLVPAPPPKPTLH